MMKMTPEPFAPAGPESFDERLRVQYDRQARAELEESELAAWFAKWGGEVELAPTSERLAVVERFPHILIRPFGY